MMASSRSHRRLHRKDRTPPSRAEHERQSELDSLMESLQALKCSSNNNNSEVADEIASLLKQKLQLKPRANDDEMFRQMTQVMMSFNLEGDDDDDEQEDEYTTAELLSSSSSDSDANTTAAHYKENSGQYLLKSPRHELTSSPLRQNRDSNFSPESETSVATDMAKAVARHPRSSRRSSISKKITSPPAPERSSSLPRSSSLTKSARKCGIEKSPSLRARIFGNRNKGQPKEQEKSLLDQEKSLLDHVPDQGKVQEMRMPTTGSPPTPPRVSIDPFGSNTPEQATATDATPQRSNKKLGPVSVDSPHSLAPPIHFPTPPSTGNFPTPIANSNTLFSPDMPPLSNNMESPLLTPMEMGQTPNVFKEETAMEETETPPLAPPQPDACPTGVGKMRRKTATPTQSAAAASAAANATAAVAFNVGAGPKIAERRAKIKARRGHRAKKKAAAPAVPPNDAAFPNSDAMMATLLSTQQPQPASVPPTQPNVPSLQSQPASVPPTRPNVPSMFPKTAPAPTPPAAEPSATTRFVAPEMTPTANEAENQSPCDMEVEGTTPKPESEKPTVDIPFFSIGKGDKKMASPSKRSSPVYMRRRQRLQQRHQKVSAGLFTKSSPVKEQQPAPDVKQQQPAPDVSKASSADTTESSSSVSMFSEHSDVDYSGAKARVSALRDEARTAYINGKYQESISLYTDALKVHVQHSLSPHATDENRAVLLANRAAALLMIGANAAAAADCQRALEFCSGTTNDGSSEGGPVLKSKLYNRLGRSFLKMAKLDEAESAFTLAIGTADATLAQFQQYSGLDTYKESEKYLIQVSAESTLGKTEVKRCRDALAGIEEYSGSSTTIPNPIGSNDRRNNMQALVYVDTALNISAGDDNLHETKVTILSALKRWREVISHCERLAAEKANLDGAFVGDLEPIDPLFGVPEAQHLSPTYFENSDNMALKLSPKAVGDAVLRLPHKVLPVYLRALRLEERYPQAHAGLQALETFVNQQDASERVTLRMKFAWLSRELEKVKRTMSGKDRGDALFRNGDYLRAAAQYAECLTIDAEGTNINPIGDSTNAGGRVHAVLHCNRAACLMALNNYQEAVIECTAALRIHSHYMKAMLRRCRCYARLERYAESIVEYKRWLEFVEEARKGDVSPNTPCLFDLPADVSAEDEKKVKQELLEAVKAKQKAESSARSAANAQEERQRWYNETFGNSSSSRQGDAQKRREQWYNQQGSSSSRRWDSFGGRGPGKSSFFRREQQNTRQHSGRQYQNSSNTQQKAPAAKSPDASVDHYAALQIRRNATQADVKKAYRKMALKYHPDKNKDEAAADKFRRVNEAYEVLSDDASRRRYDNELLFARRF